ncbi:MAG TPA: acyl-CoA dehydrogenase family protein [Acidimicrobiales bacterium]|nr:acyl-CoA dehydrogenase family protein [Acidimicrobiales bacterium]
MDAADFEQIRQAVRAFVRDRVVPLEERIDRDDEIPAEVQDAAKAMGLYGFAIPERFGGLGLGMHEECRLVFELGYTTPAFRSLFGSNNGIAGHVLLEGATDAQRERWLPRLASGELVASFALTEPEAGSDPSALTTSARRDGGGWVLDGAKRYITNAPVADVFMVFARTGAAGSPGISSFMVDRSAAGLTVGPRDKKMGQAGAWTADVFFDGVRVDAEALVGGDEGIGRGWSTAMRCLAHGRIHIAALCVGMAERLVDESVEYARTRRQSGRPIGAFQLVQAMIADSVTDLHAGRAVVLDAARAYDSGDDRRVAPSVAKYFSSEMVGRVADRAVQVHGGAGYMRGTAVERLYRDARLFRIYEGTSQIQQLIIARNVIGDAAAD